MAVFDRRAGAERRRSCSAPPVSSTCQRRCSCSGQRRDEADAHIRIFTPSLELPFAGHPVLGTAFVLGERLGLDTVRLRDRRRGRRRRAARARDGRVVFGEMSQPMPTWTAVRPRRRAARGARRASAPSCRWRSTTTGPRHTYVRLPTRRRWRRWRPTSAPWGGWAPSGSAALPPTGRAGQDADVRARARRRRGSGHRIGGRPAGVHLARHGRGRLRRARRDPPGRRDRPAVDALRRGRGRRPSGSTRVLVGGAAVVVARGEYRLD